MSLDLAPPPRVTVDRLLARSLLMEALHELCRQPAARRRTRPSTGHPVGRPRRWSPAQCITALDAFLAQHGRAPLWAEWRRGNQHHLPGQQTVRRIFGSTQALKDAAGVTTSLGLSPRKQV